MGGIIIQWIHNSKQEKDQIEQLLLQPRRKGKEKGGVVWELLTKTTKLVSALVPVLEDRLRFPY